MAKRKIIRIDEAKCNGCGECIPKCHEGALKIVDGKARLVSEVFCDGLGACLGHCPQGAITIEEREALPFDEKKVAGSELRQWPIQLMLVPERAPYLNGADLLIAADCVPFAYPDFHRELLRGKVLLVACPKLDDLAFYKEKLGRLIQANDIRSITYAHMEVPCCFGLIGVIEDAIEASKKKIPFTDVTITIQGEKR